MGESAQFSSKLLELEPYLSGGAKREIRALSGIMSCFPGKTLVEIEHEMKGVQRILEQFPGQSVAEISKQLRVMEKAANKTIPFLTDRAKSLCYGKSNESVEELMKDINSLSTTELAKLGKRLGFDLSGSKDEMLGDLHNWIASAGGDVPPSEEERQVAKAKQLARKVSPSMSQVSGDNVDEFLGAIDNAFKSLKASGFQAFAEELGVQVKGGKAEMKKQFRNVVKRLAVTDTQTQF